METIKNYLESMFRSMPHTQQVEKAKSELFQMMEDKYTELINEGKSENEAVVTVISEFGNLDELAEDLGITSEINAKKTFTDKSRKVTKEEVKGFLAWRNKAAFLRAIGIGLCIISVISPIMMDGLGFMEVFGAVGLFVLVAIGVGFIVFSAMKNEEFEFLREGPCSLDDEIYEMVKNEKRKYSKTYSINLVIAISLFILSVVPSIIFDDFRSNFMENLGASMLFIFVALGVFLLVFASIKNSSLNFLLSLNSNNPYMIYNGEQNTSANKEKVYYNPSSWSGINENKEIARIKNPTLRKILSVYWITVTCIYFIWSFITFKWHITWIIWPIAGVVYGLINALADKEDIN